MSAADFYTRFHDWHEIGRFVDEHRNLSVFYDDGHDVGRWTEETHSAIGRGSILFPEHALAVRMWYASKRVAPLPC